MSRPRNAAAEAFIKKFIEKPRETKLVPLSRLKPLDEAPLDLGNREVDRKRITRKVNNWCESAAGVLVVIQLAPGDGSLYILSGHHRREGLVELCEIYGIDQEDKLVKVEIVTPADAEAANLDVREFCKTVMKACNDQKGHRLVDTLQHTQLESPWVARALDLGLRVEFNPNIHSWYTWSAILRAYISVRRAHKKIRAGATGAAVTKKFVLRASPDDMLDAWLGPDPQAMQTLLTAINKWENKAAYPLSGRVNLRDSKVIAFLALTHFDPHNQRLPADLLSGLPARFVNPKKSYFHPDKGTSLRETIDHMLAWANRNRWVERHLVVFSS